MNVEQLEKLIATVTWDPWTQGFLRFFAYQLNIAVIPVEVMHAVFLAVLRDLGAVVMYPPAPPMLGPSASPPAAAAAAAAAASSWPDAAGPPPPPYDGPMAMTDVPDAAPWSGPAPHPPSYQSAAMTTTTPASAFGSATAPPTASHGATTSAFAAGAANPFLPAPVLPPSATVAAAAAAASPTTTTTTTRTTTTTTRPPSAPPPNPLHSQPFTPSQPRRDTGHDRSHGGLLDPSRLLHSEGGLHSRTRKLSERNRRESEHVVPFAVWAGSPWARSAGAMPAISIDYAVHRNAQGGGGGGVTSTGSSDTAQGWRDRLRRLLARGESFAAIRLCVVDELNATWPRGLNASGLLDVIPRFAEMRSAAGVPMITAAQVIELQTLVLNVYFDSARLAQR